MIKAVFIDIDETLTNSNREITQNTKNEIQRCINKGIKIILTSGRSRQEAIEYQEQAGTSPYIISSNGASCYDKINNVEIYNNPINKENLKDLLEYSIQNQYKIKLNYENKLVLNRATYPDEQDKIKSIEELKEIIQTKQIVQCVICHEQIKKMLTLKEYLSAKGQLQIINESKKLKNPKISPSKIYYCDITSKEVSKGNAVIEICKYLNLNTNEIITIGDGENDISMLALTQNSYAMGNAMEKVKASAKHITLTNDEEGVAEVLKQL